MSALSQPLTSVIPCTSLSAIVVDPLAGTPPEFVFFHNGSSDHLVRYAMHYKDSDPMGHTISSGAAGPHLLSDFVGHREYGRDAYTGELLDELRLRHIMGISMPLPDGQVLALAMHREQGLNNFRENERAALGLVSRDIASAAFSCVIQERALRVEASPPTDGLGYQAGVVVFDDRRAVTFADAVAKDLLSRLEGVAVSDLPRPDFPTMTRSEDGRKVALRRYPVPGSPNRTLVLIEAMAPSSEERMASAADKVKLTRRERQVAALAIEGLGNRHIAFKLGCSPVTVAVHLKKVYAKAGVAGRTELATWVLSGSRG
ncbi:LuxR C-terminal-related transcriptional regulator [Planctomycetota bacterium]|nr:LuxR C-terminal-related transcriptional regulator [Planctomycetota bacterium]